MMVNSKIIRTNEALSFFAAALFFAAVFFIPAVSFAQTKMDIRGEIKKLHGQDQGDKFSAIEKLGRSGDNSARRELLDEFSSQKDKRTRIKIAEALGNFRDTEPVSGLSQAFAPGNSIDLRYAAAVSLGNIGDPASVSELEKAAFNLSENMDIRLCALEGISRAKNKERGFNALVKACSDEDPLIKRTALGLLWQNYYPGKKEAIIGIIAKLSSDKDSKVSASARELAGKIPVKK